MATEIAFCVRGKTTKQSLFIDEADWERPLSDIRTIIQQQDLFVPLEFRFLTLIGNAIGQPCELNLLLKDITHNRGERKDEGIQDLDGKEEDTKCEKVDAQPEIWVTALKVIFASTNQGQSSQSNENEAGSQTTGAAGQCSACPFKSFAETFRREGASMSVMKVLFCIAVVLFAILASLTLTMHMMVKVFTNMNPIFHDALHKLKHDLAMGSFEGDSGSSSSIHSRLSEMEASHKFEIEQLTTRLAELEDLYLKDLAIHKRELSLLKKQMVAGDEEEGVEKMTAENDAMEVEAEDGGNYKKYSTKPKAKAGERIRG